MSTNQIMISDKIIITRVQYMYILNYTYSIYLCIAYKLFYKGLSEYFTRLTYISG